MSGKSRERIAEEEALQTVAQPGQGLYKPTFPARARDAALLGASNPEIAELLGISESTFEQFLRDKPLFRRSVLDGRGNADAKVARAGYRRAIGYTLNDTSVKKDGNGQVVEIINKKKHTPADTNMIKFWLTNRQPDKWRDRSGSEANTTINLMQIVEASLGESVSRETTAPELITYQRVDDEPTEMPDFPED